MIASQTWAQFATERSQQAGYRMGAARAAVIELLAEQDCALSASDVADTLQSIGRASAFRILQQLDRLDLVRRIELGDGMARFEPVHPRGDHHHHMVCDSCGKIFPFEDPGLERAIDRLSRRAGSFDVQAHDVTLHGACDACSA